MTPVTAPILEPDLGRVDRDVLRRLAEEVARLAARPEEATKRERWRRHNQLETTEPMVFIDPENGWNEIITEATLRCESRDARRWERQLRREIYWGEHLRDDRVIEPFFRLPYRFQDSGWGLNEVRHGGEHGGAYNWDAAMKSYDDFDLLKFPEYRIDVKGSQKDEALLTRLFGDVLPVQRRTEWFWTLGMTWTLANLRGMESMMLDMFDEPENLHRIMAFLRDGTLARIQWLEDQGFLTPNNDGTYVGSGGFGWTDELPAGSGPDGRTMLQDQWGFAESQETVGVSPDHFAEFILPYQKPILARYGLACYGCCEPMDLRWSHVRDIPNLRRVSVSPWANVAVMAENLQDRYVFSWKASPTMIAAPDFVPERVAADLKLGLSQARGCCVEVIMKDTNTLSHEPERAGQWVELARRAIDAVHG